MKSNHFASIEIIKNIERNNDIKPDIIINRYSLLNLILNDPPS